MDYARPLQVPALGRMNRLGDFYDARKDAFTYFNVFSSNLQVEDISSTEATDCKVDFIQSDSINEKLRTMDISAEFSVSILSGLVEVKGSGSYLTDYKKSKRAERMTLMYMIRTVSEKIHVLAMKDKIDMDALEGVDATHIIVGIEWGARCNVTCEYDNKENVEKEEIKGKLNLELNKLKGLLSVRGEAEADIRKKINENETKFTYNSVCDVSSTKHLLPSSFECAVKQARELPLVVAETNEGRGIPLTYMMVPIPSVANMLKVTRQIDSMLKSIDDVLLLKTRQFMEHTVDLKQTLFDLKTDFTENSKYICDEDLTRVIRLSNEFELEDTKFKTELAKVLVQIRSGEENRSKLGDILTKYQSSGALFTRVENCIREHNQQIHKLKIIEGWTEKGIIYLGKNDNFENLILEHFDFKIYLLCLVAEGCEVDHNKRQENILHFIRLHSTYKSNNKIKFVVADCDVANFHTISETCIHLYVNAMLRTNNLLVQKENILPDTTKIQQNFRTLLQMPCPNFFNGDCPSDSHLWNCIKCKEVVEIDINDKIVYCKCGQSLNGSFRCNREEHGSEFVQCDNLVLDLVLSNLNVYREVNILIVGGISVGKSTWINGIANYLKFPTIHNTLGNDLLCLIQSKYSYVNNEGKTFQISIGTDDGNEMRGSSGQSVTQAAFAHSLYFPEENIVVRLIDTPGIGDSRGVEQDRKHVQDIINHLSFYKEIHGICVLLLPHEITPSPTSVFCINELLSQLHRSAMRNIIFCFTHRNRSTYSIADSNDRLQELLNQIPDLQIQLSDENCFHFDNEAYRFLGYLLTGFTAMEYEFQDNAECWEIAATETIRLIKCISTFEPHRVDETLSINRARTIIRNLSNSLSRIDEIIKNEDNNAEIKEVREEIQQITTVRSQIGSFVKRNSILPFNNTIKGHLQHLKKAAINNDNYHIVCKIEEEEVKYNAEHTMISNAINNEVGPRVKSIIGASELENVCSSLYKLNHHGESIQMLTEYNAHQDKRDIHCSRLLSPLRNPGKVNMYSLSLQK